MATSCLARAEVRQPLGCEDFPSDPAQVIYPECGYKYVDDGN